jgi:transcription antitermination protein NusB
MLLGKNKFLQCESILVMLLSFYVQNINMQLLYKIRQKLIIISKGVNGIMKRRTAREKALQALFQIDVSNTDPASAIEHVLEGESGDDYLTKLVLGVVETRGEIDPLIIENLEKWTMDRLATVDRNLLRMAVYELMYLSNEIPANVILDEAIEIAKIYGDEQSSRFINGVLSKVKEKL